MFLKKNRNLLSLAFLNVLFVRKKVTCEQPIPIARRNYCIGIYGESASGEHHKDGNDDGGHEER
jgi:hypothetical protein